MRRRVRVVCRPASCPGFLLAGVRAIPARDAVEASAHLRRLVADPAVGVLLVEDDLFHALADELRSHQKRRALPVMVPFPGPDREGRPSAETELVEILRRARCRSALSVRRLMCVGWSPARSASTSAWPKGSTTRNS